MNQDKWNGKFGRKVDLLEEVRKRDARSPGFAAEFAKADLRHKLAFKLAQLREEKGLSQAALATLLKTSQAAISRLESASYEGHTVSTLRKVAEATGTTLVIGFVKGGAAETSKLETLTGNHGFLATYFRTKKKGAHVTAGAIELRKQKHRAARAGKG